MKARRRITYALLLLATIGLGLLSRSAIVPASSFLEQYAGDVLWAMAVYWLLATLMPHHRIGQRVSLTLVIAFSVEVSQLYHDEWTDQLRSYWLAALFLGFHFLWSDLVCYTAGTILAGIMDTLWLRRNNSLDPH